MPRKSLAQCVEEKRCALCELPDQPEDVYCHGCGAYVCIICSVNDSVMGGHYVVEHEDNQDDDNEA